MTTKSAHYMWDIVNTNGTPVAVRKVEETSHAIGNPYMPVIGDKVTVVISGNSLEARVADYDGDNFTIYTKSGVRLDNIAPAWLKYAQATAPSRSDGPDVQERPDFDPTMHVTKRDDFKLDQNQSAVSKQLNSLLEARGGRVVMMNGPFMIVIERVAQGGVKRQVYKLSPNSIGAVSYDSVDQLVNGEELSTLYPEMSTTMADSLLRST